MKRGLIVCALIAVISCKSYRDFNGYASNDNSDCYSDNIFLIEEDDKIFPENYVDSTKLGTIIKENDMYIYEYRRNSKGYYIPVKEKTAHIIKNLWYNKNRKIRQIEFGIRGTDIYKNIEYNDQGNIIKDTLYNDYNICWKEALAIAKHKARKEIQRFKVTDLDLSGYVDNDNTPKWHVRLTPDGEETLESYYSYIHYHGGEGKFKGYRNIIIDANTGAVLEDYRQRVTRIPVDSNE